jgi:hypothetical protein
VTDILDLGSWCILRTASADTVPVAESLAEAGIETWTPIERQLPRRKGGDEVKHPVLPTFVFAAAHEIPTLARLAMTPNREHRRFTMFRYMNGFPLVADYALNALRREEQRLTQVFEAAKRRGRKPITVGEGTTVRLTKGAYAGLDATVRGQRGDNLFVDIPGWGMGIRISSIMLADELEQQQQAA